MRVLLQFERTFLLLGLGSGNGNGYQATSLFREMEKGTSFRVPIIALTGADPNSVDFECDDSEMDGIILKPLTFEQAKKLIQRYVFQKDVKVPGLKEFKN